MTQATPTRPPFDAAAFTMVPTCAGSHRTGLKAVRTFHRNTLRLRLIRAFMSWNKNNTVLAEGGRKSMFFYSFFRPTANTVFILIQLIKTTNYRSMFR